MNEEALLEDKKHLTRSEKRKIRKYLLTKRNSLSFSINLSLFVILAAVLEAIIILVVGLAYISEFDNIAPILGNYQLGQAIPMIVAIPLLLYTRTQEHITRYLYSYRWYCLMWLCRY